MYAIQAFWLVALAAADTIAIWPVSPISEASRSTSLVPIPSVDAWLMNMSRQVGAAGAQGRGVAGRHDQRVGALGDRGLDRRDLRRRRRGGAAGLGTGLAEGLKRG